MKSKNFVSLNLNEPDERAKRVVEHAEPENLAPDTETLNKLKADDLLAFNSEAERMFCDFVCSLLDDAPRWTQSEVIQEASFELNISPVTAKRYLTKHTARRARFEIVNKLVRCKAHVHERRFDVKVFKRENAR